MKKVLVLAFAVALFASVLSSCASSKPPCPAYRTQATEAPAAVRM